MKYFPSNVLTVTFAVVLFPKLLELCQNTVVPSCNLIISAVHYYVFKLWSVLLLVLVNGIFIICYFTYSISLVEFIADNPHVDESK